MPIQKLGVLFFHSKYLMISYGIFKLPEAAARCRVVACVKEDEGSGDQRESVNICDGE